MKQTLLKTIAYFEVFNYPLTIDEISKLHPNMRSVPELLKELADDGVLTLKGDYVGVGSDLEEAISSRKRGNVMAKRFRNIALKKASLISRFPFVRAVMISGSFSKGVMHEGGDIDFFIVTSPGRLWTARTLLIAYKKIFLSNSHEYFCVNYLVDQDHLEIQEQNIFTAIELSTLLPAVNHREYTRILKANEWIEQYQTGSFHNSKAQEFKKGQFQKVIEKLLGNQIGDFLEQKFMKVTIKKWKKKFNYLETEDFDIALKSTTNVSKHHPNNFQKKVLERHEEILKPLLNKLNETQNVEATV